MASPLIAYYMWGMRPGETQAMPETALRHNAPLFEASAVINPGEIERLALGGAGIPGLAALWHRIPRWIIRADLGRLLFVYAHGGFYCDADCELQRPLPALLSSGDQAYVVLFVEDRVSLDKLGPRESKDPAHSLRIANFAFGASAPWHPFLRAVLEECVCRLAELLDGPEAGGALSELDVSELDVVWVCGPDVITTVYHRRARTMGLSPEDVVLLDKSAANHLTFGSWRGR